MKKSIIKLLAALAVLLGASAAFAGTASAGVYWGSTSCAHGSIAKWICYDVSSGTTTIHSPGSNTVFPSGSAFSPSRGYIAFDVYECNASPSGDTGFNTSGAYGLPTSIRWVDGNFPAAAGNINVSTYAMNVIAWYANSQTGYACFVVP